MMKDETIIRLCRAIVTFKKVEKFLSGEETNVLSEPIDEIENSVLDLLDVPENRDVRMDWWSELYGLVTPTATDRGIRMAIARMRELNGSHASAQNNPKPRKAAGLRR